MLSKEVCHKVLEELLSTNGDYAEIYEENKFSSSINSINGIIEKSNSGTKYGIGLRIYHGLSSVYSYTNDNSLEGLLKCAKKLALSISGPKQSKVLELVDVHYDNINVIKKYPREVSTNEKIGYIKKAFEAAFNYDELITKVIVNYLDEDQEVLIASSSGKYAYDRRVHTRIFINAICEHDGKMQDGLQSPGASKGIEFLDEIDLEQIARDAALQAKTMLFADECPSGIMDVVINNGFGGVIFHEACGHSLEATGVAKNQSVFANKLGQKIASELVTAVDDGTIPNAWGSSNIDDEGNPTKKRVLIENGILKSYMIDQLNARRMKCDHTSSGRREGYEYEPTSRMSNTFICNGTSTFDEIIKNTKFGLFAKNLGGGSVNPATGDYNFAVREGYLIEDGKITKPVKGATLVGNGVETLLNIDMVANNLERQQGMCGSISGSIPADVGQPTIRVKNMNVGGRGGVIR